MSFIQEAPIISIIAVCQASPAVHLKFKGTPEDSLRISCNEGTKLFLQTQPGIYFLYTSCSIAGNNLLAPHVLRFCCCFPLSFFNLGLFQKILDPYTLSLLRSGFFGSGVGKWGGILIFFFRSNRPKQTNKNTGKITAYP